MTTRELLTTIAICVLTSMGALAVPMMGGASAAIVAGTGIVSFSTTGLALIFAMGIDPRSQFMAKNTPKVPENTENPY